MLRCRLPDHFGSAVTTLGVSIDILADRAGIDRDRLLDDLARFSVVELGSIWAGVAALVDGEAIGVRLARASADAGRGPVSMVVLAASTLRDGLCRAIHFEPLYSPERFTIENRGDLCIVGRNSTRHDDCEPAVAAEFALARILDLVRTGTGTSMVPAEVHLAAARTCDCNDDVPGFPVRFGADRNALVFRRRDLDLPFVTADADLSDLLLPGLLARLEQIDAAGSIAGRATAIIRRRLIDGRPDIASVAHDMAMSQRTLQRRLREEDSSFRALIETVRRELSTAMLSRGDVTLDRVAFDLGYRGTVSFHRAFRNWVGTSPVRWRRTPQLRSCHRATAGCASARD